MIRAFQELNRWFGRLDLRNDVSITITVRTRSQEHMICQELASEMLQLADKPPAFPFNFSNGTIYGIPYRLEVK